MKERFYPADCAVFPAGKGEFLVRNRNAGKILFLPAAQYEFFRFLNGCISFEEHLSTLVQANRYGLAVKDLRGILSSWVDSGLLRPESLLHHQEQEGQKLERPGLFSAVITSDRPESLEKWLDSRITHPDFSGSRIPVYVFDDSREQNNGRRNRQAAAARKQAYTGELVYFGEEEKQLFRESLVDACTGEGIAPQLVNFALQGPEDGSDYIRTGANRNTALLITGRGRTWFSDDDLYYRMFSHPEARLKGWRFEGGGYSKLKFFASHEEMLNYAVNLEYYNLPLEINAHLGTPLGSYTGSDEDLRALSPETAREIEERKGLVGAVGTGYCGARWFTDRFFIDSQRYFADDEMYLNKERYFAAVATGLNIHAPDAPALRDGLNMQGGGLALDGTLELPAWFPLDRHEDSSFGMLFLAVNHTVRTLHLPAALYHDTNVVKPELSGASRDLLPGPGRMHQIVLGEILRQFVSGSAEARLKEAAQKYIRIAALSTASFEEYLRVRYGDYAGNRMEFITRLLEIYSAEPEWWAESLAEYRDALKKTMPNPLSGIPAGFQKWLKLYGELLEAWPLIREKSEVLCRDRVRSAE